MCRVQTIQGYRHVPGPRCLHSLWVLESMNDVGEPSMCVCVVLDVTPFRHGVRHPPRGNVTITEEVGLTGRKTGEGTDLERTVSEESTLL